ncbi:delta-type opioid receptor-like isoform X2 [Acanthaster planci]|uniref:Delta-type opioid receptor-like isoform X2 n=1 Tax=Acanthaster planci TaxID=133434 RepID=A0A8B7Y2E9_ACAPL|nr:delta-type opioid receptor-like isoform X2 [Acanthaster planci]
MEELSCQIADFPEANATTDSYNHSQAIDQDQNDVIQVAVFATSMVIAGLGLLGNGLVIGLFFLNWSLTRTLTSLYIFHQSVIDFVSSAMFAALQLDRWKPLLAVEGWVGVVSCKVWYSKALFWSLLHISTINLVLVTLERYVSVLHPIFRRNHFTRRKAKLTMLLAWLVGLSYQSYWVVVSQNDQGRCYQEFPSDVIRNLFGGLTFLVEYLIPLSIMSFAYVRIISRLKKLSKYGDRSARSSLSPRKRAPSSNSPVGLRDRRRSGPTQLMLVKARRNVTKTLCLVFATYVICWTPVEIEYIVYSAGFLKNQSIPELRATKVLVMCNMCANPFIYAAKYREFQEAARRTWNRLQCREFSTAPYPPSPSV